MKYRKKAMLLSPDSMITKDLNDRLIFNQKYYVRDHVVDEDNIFHYKRDLSDKFGIRGAGADLLIHKGNGHVGEPDQLNQVAFMCDIPEDNSVDPKINPLKKEGIEQIALQYLPEDHPYKEEPQEKIGLTFYIKEKDKPPKMVTFEQLVSSEDYKVHKSFFDVLIVIFAKRTPNLRGNKFVYGTAMSIFNEYERLHKAHTLNKDSEKVN